MEVTLLVIVQAHKAYALSREMRNDCGYNERDTKYKQVQIRLALCLLELDSDIRPEHC